ncbi:hypothetical protein [Aeromicrobium sp.]|uniref:hypothetical protein n=1 Tax=Aeromicrobium sp. TaxID=1871063 RepID=UPI0019828AED|nr:hypothetical protein [Aeromicrobium sp.]MBC7632139.1 hypothetical protein [Aeromicrobium sp.]
MTDTTQRFTLRQKITLMVNRYELRALGPDGVEGPLIALAQQKRMAFKEEVTFYADEARTQPVFGFKARTRMDLAATYDVTDAQGAPIGEFRKDFAKSLMRSTWHLSTPAGIAAVGQERSQGVAIARRIISMVGEIPIPLRFHFDFTTPAGEIVLSSERQRSIRDRYELTLPTLKDGTALDWRVGAAMAVALDALQAR